MSHFFRLHRHDAVLRVRRHLEREGYPRLQMLLLVTLTGGAGFVASFLLLHAGLLQMWLRYLAALGVAYAVFLGLLWLWLRTRAADYTDIPDLSGTGFSGPGPGTSTGPEFSGGGGGFGGGGAGGSFDGAAEPPVVLGESGSQVGDALGSVAEAEEFAIPLVLLLFAAALVGSAFFMIYTAPVLFAELLVDGVLSASLYRRLRGLETDHWLETALRRTVWPFVLTAVLVTAAGWGMSLYAPGARSIGEVLAHAQRATP